MALFQPTNIIPSSFTVGVVDAAQNNAQVSWQVNGNSPMTSYQIDFFQNDANSTPIAGAGTGKISDGIPTGGFYGTDRFGQPKMFTWTAGKKWNSYNTAFVNGNQYKFKITQWYSGQDSVISCETATSLEQGKTYYFQEQDGAAIIVFTAPETLAGGNNDIYFSYTTGSAWVDTRSRIVVGSGYRVADGTVPLGAQKVDGVIAKKNLDELFVSQIEPNVFIMRDTPQLSIQRSGNAEFSDLQAFPSGSTLPASIGYFVAIYSQAQDAPVREARWQVATWVDGAAGDILADTGDVDTPTLQFEFNGFFIGNEYAVRCFGEADYQTYGTQDFDSGWTHFTADVPEQQGTYSGNFTVQCLPRENAALLKWEAIEVIPPETTPGGFNPTTLDGTLTLPKSAGKNEYSVAWKERVSVSESGEPQKTALNFSAPWSAAWKGRVRQTSAEIEGFSSVQKNNDFGNGYLLKYSPDGKHLLYYRFAEKRLKLYTVSEGGIAFKGWVLADGTITNQSSAYSALFVNDFAFSKERNFLAVGTNNSISLYSFANGTFLLLDTLPAQIENGAQSLAFSQDGNYLAAGSASPNAWSRVYRVSGNRMVSVCDLQNQSSGAIAPAIDFNYNGSLICVGRSDGAYLYSFSGSGASSAQKLPTVSYTYNVAFAKKKSTDMLIISGQTADYQFKISGASVQLIGVLSDTGTIYQGISRSIEFSPDGDALLVGGTGFVNLYSVKNGELHYEKKVATSNWTNVTAISWNPTMNQVAILSEGGSGMTFSQIIQPAYIYSYYPQGKFFEVQGSDVQLTAADNVLTVRNGTGALANFTYPAETTEAAVVLTPTAAYAYFYGAEGLLSQTSAPVTYTQQPVTSVAIFGGDSGATVDSVSVYQGDGSDILSAYEDPAFEPVWNSESYTLYMTANFNGNLDGGTSSASGVGFRVYRQEIGSDILTPIASLPATQTSLKDYGIRSRKSYKYSLYAYDSNQAFMKSVDGDTVVSTCFKNYSLLVCDYDSENDAYHVRKQYLFALNLSAGSVGNNNSPTLNANFTAYPTRMPSTQNYASGTLQGLIGAIYTVPALVEQVGGFKHTAKPSTLDYFDSVDLEKELYDLSVAPYQLFLRDMKGHLRMIATNGAISMTPNLKQRQQSITISFPWVEVGDASDVTIIQTPDDYGWNNDNQVLGVRLVADPETGILTATYPKPYEGTKFYLTGAQKEILAAKTPLGATPAKFGLSTTAEEPDDGTLTATAKVNAEGEK